MAEKCTSSARESAGARTQCGASAVERALSELSAAQRVQRAAEELRMLDTTGLTQLECDARVTQVLLDGLQAACAGVARLPAGRNTVRLVTQRRSHALQETTELDATDAAWLERLRAGRSVELDDAQEDALLAQLGARSLRLEPVRGPGGVVTAFLLVADQGAASAPAAVVGTFLEVVARWTALDRGAPEDDVFEPDVPAAAAAPADNPETVSRSDEALRGPGGLMSLGGPAPRDGAALLAGVVEHIDEGVVVYDAQLTVLAANTRAKEMLHIPPGILMVGGSMVDFVTYCAERGDYGPGAADNLVRARIRDALETAEDVVLETHFGDGRIVSGTRRHAGHGTFVVNYKDVTDERENESVLAHDRELLQATVEHMDQGLFAFDRELKFIYVNERARALLDLPRDVFDVGCRLEDMMRASARRGDYGEGDIDQLVADLRKKSSGTKDFSFERSCPGGVTALVRCRPREEGGMVVTLTDITESRRQRDALSNVSDQLARAGERLDLAIRSMSQGLAMFDQDQNLLVCNKPILEMFGLPEKYGRPGTPFDVFLRAIERFGEGTVADSIAARGERFVEETVLGDGRVIEIMQEPIEEGGWLALFTDVTERTLQQKALKEASEALERKSYQLEKMFNNMGRGVAMFDAEQRLVICNPLYAEMFDFPQELLRPGADLSAAYQFCVEHRYKPRGLQARAERADIAKLREPQQFKRELVDGRIIHAMHEPLDDGGSLAIFEDVTERERAERQLRDYAARLEQQRGVLQAIMENLDQGVSLIDADLMVQAMNRRCIELLDFPPDLVTPGIGLDVLFRYNAERGEYGPGDVEQHVAIRMELARKFEPHRFERTRPDGTIIEVAGSPIKGNGGFVTTYTDVTEARRHEAEVKALADKLTIANRHLDAAFNSMNQGLAMFDKDLRLVVRNKRYLELFRLQDGAAEPGATLEEVTRHSIDAGNEGDPDVLARRVEIARSRERIVFHRAMADGRTIEIIHEPLSDGGSIALYLDVTDRIASERKLRDYTARLEASNRELQDFAYVASHDLQEPLRKIEAFGDRLQRKCGERLGDDGRVYVERMQDSSRRLRTLINDLLDYSRITTKAKPFEEVDLNKVLGEVQLDLETSLEEAGGRLEVGELPSLEADGTQMRQLALNLISNALKFRRPETPPVVSVSATLVDDPHDPSRPRSWCELAFKDNGIGFSNKYAERIFTIFQRLHSRASYEGTGIGLATCRKIAERHGGEITASGSPGEGAVLTVRLPLRQDQRAPQADAEG